ncbi:MAG: hypothetical protein ACW98D_11505 [Promethearchaeota archaeon]|jgi:hypothetical protein
MEEGKKTHENGLQVFPIDDINYGIRYCGRYPFPNGIPYKQFCSIVDDDSKAHPKKVFDTTIKIINPKADLAVIRKQLREQMLKFIPNELGIDKDTDEDTEMELLEETDFNEIKPTELEEIISIVTLGSRYKLKNRPWLSLLGAPSIGKSESLSFYNDKRIVHWSGRQTRNALLSGKPNKEVEDPYAVLRECKGKCLVYNDVALLIGGGEDSLENQIGILTDAYGKNKLVIEDPAGRREIKTYFGLIWGMTWLQYKILIRHTSKMGQRFLMYTIPTNSDVEHYDQDDYNDEMKEKRKQQLISHIINTAERYLKLPEYSDELKKVASDFAKRIVRLRNLFWGSARPSQIEHHQRLMNQLLTCTVLRAMLWNREPQIEDFNLIKKLVIPTIYKLDALKYFTKDKDVDKLKTTIKDKWEILKHNLISFGITDEHLNLDDEYRTLLISL